MGVLVLITGTGRSGTSTMSGTFHHLGLHVPGPYLGANESNPKGFFESKWAVAFHKEIVKAARIHDFDSRPAAFERAQEAWSPQRRARLASFLTEQAAQGDQVVVKDPRSVWAQGLWRDAAAEAGLEIRYVSMLRHPAEVIGSRATYYASSGDEEKRRRYETFNVARWINSSVLSERETRGSARAFVRYTDLLTDWRPVLTTLGADLGLRFDPDPAAGGPSPVDDFIDPDLRRHQVTWDELQIPAELQDVAQRIWDALEILADAHGEDAAASAEVTAQGERYARLFEDAAAISHDAMEEARDEARRAGEESARSAPASAPATPAGRGRTPDDLGGRELLRLLGGRVRTRVTRPRG
ncbi:sulfotransferase [Nocardioides sp. KIGAM211]|uniref:Sulfotransferase n=1 Tax=Nocardioides luti TaxID=2761101 RepID=A0A7X0RFN2_9ACTN|nr:sulfotransferase [Nocardioides luti]MBB6627438.1 sulfotransferase [Nocardioides luti]